MDSGLFGADSTIRRVWRESIVMLGGGQRMLLMEAAHPLVAAGIMDHSGYREAAWTRLLRTVEGYTTIIFGSRDAAERTAERVRALHDRVEGRLRERCGPFAPGTPYAATDAELLLWVHASALDTALVMYGTYVGRLTQRDEEAFYDEMTLLARLFGTPAEVIPPGLDDFRVYMREMLESDRIAVSTAAREIAEVVLHPPAPAAFRPALAGIALVTVGLLPEKLREQYGFPWNGGRQAVLTVSTRATRLLLPAIDGRARFLWPAGGTKPRSLTLDLAAALGRRDERRRATHASPRRGSAPNRVDRSFQAAAGQSPPA